MKNDQPLRTHLLKLLEGRGAHANFESAIDGISPENYDAEVPGLPYTLWQLLEHLRLAQADILDYVVNPDYQERDWPKGYWPKEKSPPTKKSWASSVEKFKKDQKTFETIVVDPNTDLCAQIPHGRKGHTILREILLAADHNSYHIGQIVLIRRLLGNWED